MTGGKGGGLKGRFWITSNGKNLAGRGRIELLKRIKNTGSISAAAKEMGMSYKAAWDSVDAMNNLSELPLAQRVSGGRNGGGTVLTKAGEDFIALYDKYTETFEKILVFMEENPEVTGMKNKFGFKSSADNSFFGKVKKIERGAVSAIVTITSGGINIAASITDESVERMGLAEGSEATALINPNQLVIIEGSAGGVFSARNAFHGKVTSVKKGAVNSEISIELSQGRKLTALVTNDGASLMNVSYGMEVTAICKASAVILMA